MAYAPKLPWLLMRDDELIGGKYKGKKLDWVIKNDPQYVRWAMSKGIFRITERAEGLLKKSEKKKK